MADPFASPEEVPQTPRQRLSEIFVEEPVPLPVFVADQKFLNNPPLSPIQYEAVRHIEQILFPDTYSLMVEGFGDYWKPVRSINYATLMFGKGCILPHEEIYDQSSGRWVRVDAMTSPGTVAARIQPGRALTTARTESQPHGFGKCVRVTLVSGHQMDVYEGHKFLTTKKMPVRGKPLTDFVWRTASSLGPSHYIVAASSLECDNPVPLPSDFLTVSAFWTTYGEIGPKDTSRTFSPTVLSQYVEALSRLLGGDFPVDRFFSYQDILFLDDNARSRFDRFFERYGVRHEDGHVTRLPQALFSAPDAEVAEFFGRLQKLAGDFTSLKKKFAHIRFVVTFDIPCRTLAQDLSHLLLRLNVVSWFEAIPFAWFAGRREKFKDRRWKLRIRKEFYIHNYLTHVAKFDNRKPFASFVQRFAEQVSPSRVDPVEPGFSVAKVAKVEPIGMHDYWNLSVPEAGNYVAAGGTVHANSGKDHICRVASMRIAYLLQCLHSPQAYYGMPSQDVIHLLNVASNSTQARRSYFEPLKTIVRRSPWFESRAEVLQYSILWDNQVEMISGHSDAESQEGLNLLLGIADEIDAFKSNDDMRGTRSKNYVNSAESILEMIHTSCRTRFPEVFKAVHISFPRYVGSPIMKLLDEAKQDNERNGEQSRYYASGPYATWEVHPLRRKIDFHSDYQKDPVVARAKYECKPERAVNPFFRNFVAVKSCFRPTESPLTVQYLLETRNDTEAWVPEYDFGSLAPIPGAQYVIHADLAVRNDRAGIAMAHVSDWKEIESVVTEDDGSENSSWETRPQVMVDFVFGYEADLSAVPQREIQIRWFRNLVSELRRRGFNIALASHDGFNSYDSLQIMEAQGIKTKKFSTDINDTIWKNLQDLFYEGRISVPRNSVLLDELAALSRLPNGKVDHPAGVIGKDLADAVACAAYGALTVGGAESTEGTAENSFSLITSLRSSNPIGMKIYQDSDEPFDFSIESV